MLTTGQIITNNDGYMGTVSVDNVVRELIAAGKTWKEYSEALPYQGYDGGDTGEYAERHNPCSYFSDVRNNQSQLQNLVPFTQLATDIANHTLPNYAFIVPDLLNDAHDGTLAQADAWLQANIALLLAVPTSTRRAAGS
jgi:phosphatidylinositol-3-phosphatase